MHATSYHKFYPAAAVNVTVISLDDAPQGYRDFCKAAAKKFVIDLHRMMALFHFVLANYCSGTRSRRDDLIG
jgi:hypothetical protein